MSSKLKKWAPWILAVWFVAAVTFAGPAISGSTSTVATLDSVYVNNTPIGGIYGGGTLSATHSFTVQAIRFSVRTAGSGGTTSATFEVTDGTNTCDCSYACNQTTGGKRVACAPNAGTGCSFPLNAALQYKWTTAGDCATTTADIVGNLAIEGVWQ